MAHVDWLDQKAQYVSIKSEIDSAVSRVIGSGKYVRCEEVFAFEREFARYCGVKWAVGVRSGSDAIVLALRALGIGDGDEVLLPDNSCLSEPNAIMLSRATPVPVDIDARTYNIDPGDLASRIDCGSRAVHAVHAYGQPCDMQEITAVARQHGLPVLEDISLGPGTRIDGERVGRFGDVAVASFGHGKILNAMGNGGGIVLTNSESVAKRVRRLANYGEDEIESGLLAPGYAPPTGRAWMEMGQNSTLDSIQAAVLRVKLRHLDSWLEHRARWADVYSSLLADLPVVRPYIAARATSAYRGYLIRVKDRNRVLEYLKANGVDAATLYLPPVHLQPAMSQFGYAEGDFPVTEVVAKELLALPIYPELTQEKVEYVVDVLRRGLQ